MRFEIILGVILMLAFALGDSAYAQGEVQLKVWDFYWQEALAAYWPLWVTTLAQR